MCIEESAHDAGDLGDIPGSGRSPGEGNGNPLQYSCQEKPTERAWQVSLWGKRVKCDWVTNTYTFFLRVYTSMHVHSYVHERWSKEETPVAEGQTLKSGAERSELGFKLRPSRLLALVTSIRLLCEW